MSQFCDRTVCQFIGGNGGNGSVSFRQEKFVAFGGPDGGNGGNGGSVILIADENINTLSDFSSQKKFRAEDGENGGQNLCYGKKGADTELKVPVGTVIIDEESQKVLADLKKNNQKYIVAAGGKGGLGNATFKSSTHQAPRFAELGEKGKTVNVVMELKLVADIGIIGFPSAGKSTLISVISNAKPKIADYPFTTLIPNLGVVDLKKFDKGASGSFVVADIPGLIEGAHEGKGLGHEFLRHTSRTSVIVHLIDPTRSNIEDYKIINNELKKYDSNLAKKDQIVVISKIDAIDKEELELYTTLLIEKYPKLKGKLNYISSATNQGIKELVFEMSKKVEKAKKESVKTIEDFSEDQEQTVIRPHLNKDKFTVELHKTKKSKTTGEVIRKYIVKGERIEQVVNMTDIKNPEGLERIYHFIKKMRIYDELKKQGAELGDIFKIADKEFRMRQ